MIRRPPRSTLSSSSAASDVYKRQVSAIGGSGDLVEVEALDLVLGSDAHSEREVDDLEERQARGTDPEEIRDDANDLGEQLLRIAVEEARASGLRAAIQSAAVHALLEEAESDQPPRAVEAVDRDGADRVVELQCVLHEEGGPDDEHAGHGSDSVSYTHLRAHE